MNLACGGGSSSVFNSALKAARRQHVHFVEDIDLVARRHRRIAHGVVDLADVVDAVMRGGVHFQNVDVAAVDDRLILHAHHRHVDGRAFDRAVRQFVIERAGEDARGGGFADPAHAGQDPGLRNAARSRRRSRWCGPWRPGRSGPRNWPGGICAPARDRPAPRPRSRRGRGPCPECCQARSSCHPVRPRPAMSFSLRKRGKWVGG